MNTDSIPFDLKRFIEAQRSVYATVKLELTLGQKKSHWMWFIFPQVKGLGHSPMARRFAIESREEALAYWHDPVLGTRLTKCIRLMLAIEGKSAYDILGYPDDLKFKSSMTLFSLVAPEDLLFKQAIDYFFDGQVDAQTVDLMCGR